jgi:hypothetical protein
MDPYPYGYVPFSWAKTFPVFSGTSYFKKEWAASLQLLRGI